MDVSKESMYAAAPSRVYAFRKEMQKNTKKHLIRVTPRPKRLNVQTASFTTLRQACLNTGRIIISAQVVPHKWFRAHTLWLSE